MNRGHSRHSWPLDKSPPKDECDFAGGGRGSWRRVIKAMHKKKRRQRDKLALREFTI